jgi:hypothetical protein
VSFGFLILTRFQPGVPSAIKLLNRFNGFPGLAFPVANFFVREIFWAA